MTRVASFEYSSNDLASVSKPTTFGGAGAPTPNVSRTPRHAPIDEPIDPRTTQCPRVRMSTHSSGLGSSRQSLFLLFAFAAFASEMYLFASPPTAANETV